MYTTTLETLPTQLEAYQEGVLLLIDKPLEWTSFDVVNRIRIALCKHFGIKKLKVGHAGTLDPLASGLLILCIGKYTKNIDLIQAQEKIYTGTIKIGATTPTYDMESEVDQTFPIDHIDKEAIQNVKNRFLGSILQIPPIYSAIKKDGKRSYELARQGIDRQLEARPIEIKNLTLDDSQWPDLNFKITCSKGTYIRSLAHDIGKALGSGGYLTTLRRTGIGNYSVENAIKLDDFLSKYTQNNRQSTEISRRKYLKS